MAKNKIITFRPRIETSKELDTLQKMLDYPDRTSAIEDFLKEGMKIKRRKLILTILLMYGSFFVTTMML